MNTQYLYIACSRSLNKILYIGIGSGDRYKHIVSGCSSSYLANKHHHTLGSDDIEFIFIHQNSFQNLSELEKALIFLIQPEWNTDLKSYVPRIHVKSAIQLAHKIFYFISNLSIFAYSNNAYSKILNFLVENKKTNIHEVDNIFESCRKYSENLFDISYCKID